MEGFAGYMKTNPKIIDLEKELRELVPQGDGAAKIRILTFLAREHQKDREFQKALAAVKKAAGIAEKDGSDEDRAVVYAQMGCVLWEMAQVKKAVAALGRALSLQEKKALAHGHWEVLALLGMSYWRMGQWEEGFSYFQEALPPAKDKKADPRLNPPENDRYFGLQEVMRRGVGTLKKRVQMGKNLKDPVRVYRALFALAPLLIFTRAPEECKACLKEALHLAEARDDKEALIMIPKLLNLAESQMEQGS